MKGESVLSPYWQKSVVFHLKVALGVRSMSWCGNPCSFLSFFLSSATQFWRKKVLQVANDHRDVTFAIADEQSFMEELKDFALDDSGEEVNVGCFDDKDKKYRMDPDEEFDEDSLRDFVENFKEGKNSSFLVRNLFLKSPIQRCNDYHAHLLLACARPECKLAFGAFPSSLRSVKRG